MKNTILFTILIILHQFCFAQTVPLDSIGKYEGETVTVCSKVMGTFVGKGEKKTTYLDFGKPYPNAVLRAVIFEGDLANFKYNPSEFLKNKNVCITGKVKLYKSKPEMIIENEEQIKIK